MIASIDGRATVEGRSVKLGHPDDRALLRGVRAAADAVLAGTRTIATEGYANLLDPDERDRRVAAGRPPHPRVVTVSRDGSVTAGDAPVYAEGDVPVTVYTETATTIAGGGASVEAVALGAVAFPALLADLHARHGVTSVACEGGPGLLRELVAQGCLDELLLTVAPLLVAGDGPTPLSGDPLPGGTRMTLAGVHRADDHLFLHYVS